ncbi:MBL fold metallo-hydrolase [Lysinibacillus fusiformis]|uniref:MBL fold metallo-hydrolase n=1 Tax=Lysinibacillus fusiformis TaxID=28031 RepID=UPI003015E797
MAITVQHIRHATSIIVINNKRILIDPMLSEVGQLSPVPFTRNYRRNPLTSLPVSLNIFENVDAILLTHRHFDHWDKKSISLLNKNIPILCGPNDKSSVLKAGFTKIIAIEDTYEWAGINIKRIEGPHAPGLTGMILGIVSGFYLKTKTEGSIYIVGDCIYTPKIEKAFIDLSPDIALLNASEAEMIWGTVITMNREDIARIACLSPKTKLVAVHLDTINHCKLSRKQLSAYLKDKNLCDSVVIPQDGEIVSF